MTAPERRARRALEQGPLYGGLLRYVAGLRPADVTRLLARGVIERTPDGGYKLKAAA